MSNEGGWNQILSAEVAPDASVEVPTPDISPHADTAKAELTVGNTVLKVPDQATVEFALGAELATVTNLTETAWAIGTTLYIYVPGAEPTGDALSDLQAQVNQNTSDIADLDTQTADFDARIAALDARVNDIDTKIGEIDAALTDLDTRVAALEGAIPVASKGKK
jgi:hypothetical protein